MTSTNVFSKRRRISRIHNLIYRDFQKQESKSSVLESSVSAGVSSSPVCDGGASQSAASSAVTDHPEVTLSRIRDLEQKVEATRLHPQLTQRITLEIQTKQDELNQAENDLIVAQDNVEDFSMSESLASKSTEEDSYLGGYHKKATKKYLSAIPRAELSTRNFQSERTLMRVRSFQKMYRTIVSHTPKALAKRPRRHISPPPRNVKKRKRRNPMWDTTFRVSEQYKDEVEEVFNMNAEVNGLIPEMFPKKNAGGASVEDDSVPVAIISSSNSRKFIEVDPPSQEPESEKLTPFVASDRSYIVSFATPPDPPSLKTKRCPSVSIGDISSPIDQKKVAFEDEEDSQDSFAEGGFYGKASFVDPSPVSPPPRSSSQKSPEPVPLMDVIITDLIEPSDPEDFLRMHSLPLPPRKQRANFGSFWRWRTS